jgi:hypothetical protein
MTLPRILVPGIVLLSKTRGYFFGEGLLLVVRKVLRFALHAASNVERSSIG